VVRDNRKVEVLSKDVLALLRNARFRETLEQVMDAIGDEPQERSVPVGTAASRWTRIRECRIVTIRRLSI
jgi:hypothetical protein